MKQRRHPYQCKVAFTEVLLYKNLLAIHYVQALL